MIKRLTFLLLAAVCLALLGLLYRLNSAPESNGQTLSTNEPAITIQSSGTSPGPDFARHVDELKKKLPSAEFTIVIQPPFVVVGDESEAVVKAHSEHTVKWAVDRLKQDYFAKDPKEILDIWLFKDSPLTKETRSPCLARNRRHLT